MTEETELRALLLKGLAGDEAAHRLFLGEAAALLRAYFRNRLRGAPEDAEDLVQETLIALHTRRDSYDPSYPLTAWMYAIARYRLIDFLRRNYQAMVFDLSGNLERYSFEIMQESKRIFLVCTPEIPSLHLAREKFSFLRSLELHNRVSVLVNRCQKRQVISNDQIEQILGLPVHDVFPNDYSTVHKALTAGRWIDFSTDLGKSITRFSKTLVEVKSAAQDGSSGKKGFFSFLSGAKAS